MITFSLYPATFSDAADAIFLFSIIFILLVGLILILRNNRKTIDDIIVIPWHMKATTVIWKIFGAFLFLIGIIFIFGIFFAGSLMGVFAMFGVFLMTICVYSIGILFFLIGSKLQKFNYGALSFSIIISLFLSLGSFIYLIIEEFGANRPNTIFSPEITLLILVLLPSLFVFSSSIILGKQVRHFP